MPKFEKYIMAGLMFILTLSFAVWIKDKEINFTMFDKKLSPEATMKAEEFNSINNASIWFLESIKKTINNNEDLIDKNNCKGILYDQNNDNIYDSKILGVSFEKDSNIIVHYNFCSYVWNKDKTVSLIMTSKILLENFTETKGDLSFVPAAIYKGNAKTGTEDVIFGIIDTREIM